MEEIYTQSTFKNYEISNFGNVRNKRTGVIRSTENKYKYPIVRVSQDGRYSNLRVWREVALAFVPNPKNYNVVDHIDRNPANCHYTNLRWVSPSLNALNRKTHKNNELGIRGIRQLENSSYFCRICVNGCTSSKVFKNLEDAKEWLNNKYSSLQY